MVPEEMASKSSNLVLFLSFLVFGRSCYICGMTVPSTLYIGAIFPTLKADYEQAFLLALNEVNSNSSILPGTELIPIINKTDAYDTFENIRIVQYLLKKGVVAIIGPMTSTAVKYTQPYCAGFHVPQLAPVATDPALEFSPGNFPFLVRLNPSDSLQCRALAGLIDSYNWTNLALLASKDDYGINGLLALKDIANQKGWKIRANEHFDPIVNYSALDIKLQLRAIQKSKARLVVLNTSTRYTLVILKQAADMGMLKGWIWIVTDGSTNADWSTIPGDFPLHEYTGVIGTRPALGQGTLYRDFMKKWLAKGHREISTPGGKSYDSVLALASALDAMLRDGHNITAEALDFDFPNRADVTPWQAGSRLLDYIKKVKINGIMSNIGFTAIGSPSFVEYDIVNQGRNGFVKVGRWSKQDGLKMDPNTRIYWLSGSTEVPRDIANSVQNTTIKVIAVLEYPFVFYKTLPDGSKEFDGFCVDLLKKLKQMLKFDFVIELETNGIYGAQDIYSLEWNGMIKALIDGNADLAIGPLTISSQRQSVIDFTQPFMDVGLSILMAKETDSSYKVFSFLRPFDFHLWLAIVFTALGVGIFLWIHSTFSPYGYHGRCAQAQSDKVVPRHVAKTKNYLGFFNSIWSSFAYYVSQGPDVLHPVSPSGRVVVSVWWFAVLIIGATYTANLASFLIVERFSSAISSVEDLARQTKIHYGTVQDTQAQMFFQTSSIPTFVTMWEFMKAANSLVVNTTVGVERARTGEYAFLYDTVILEYNIRQKPCETLQLVGREFGTFGYGFGLPKDSPFTLQFSISILELRQKDYISTLKEKWLRGECDSTDSTSGSSGAIVSNSDVLTFSDMSGVFFCVFIGMGISIVVLVGELVFESYKEIKNGRKMGFSKVIFSRIKQSWLDYMSCKPPSVKPTFIITSHDSPIKSKETRNCSQKLNISTIKVEDLETRELTMD